MIEEPATGFEPPTLAMKDYITNHFATQALLMYSLSVQNKSFIFVNLTTDSLQVQSKSFFYVNLITDSLSTFLSSFTHVTFVVLLICLSICNRLQASGPAGQAITAQTSESRSTYLRGANLSNVS